MLLPLDAGRERWFNEGQNWPEVSRIGCGCRIVYQTACQMRQTDEMLL
jgi:hypothetical protein